MFFKKWNDKMGINGVRQGLFFFSFFFFNKGLNTALPKAGWPKETPSWSPNIKGPQTSPYICPSLEKF